MKRFFSCHKTIAYHCSHAEVHFRIAKQTIIKDVFDIFDLTVKMPASVCFFPAVVFLYKRFDPGRIIFKIGIKIKQHDAVSGLHLPCTGIIAFIFQLMIPLDHHPVVIIVDCRIVPDHAGKTVIQFPCRRTCCDQFFFEGSKLQIGSPAEIFMNPTFSPQLIQILCNAVPAAGTQ